MGGWLPKIHPMLKAGLTSGTIMSLGDMLCQTIEHRNSRESQSSPPFAVRGVRHTDDASSTSNRDSGIVSAVAERVGLGNYDLTRTARFFGVGLTLHGPFFNKTLGILERAVGPKTTAFVAAKKVALGHVFLFPSYAFLFNVWMGGLEGRGAFTGGVQKFKDTWYEVAIAGSVFWPAANMVNFMYCPPAHRVLFLNGGGLFWNAFLSWQNAKSNAKNTKGNELRVLGPSVVGLDGALRRNLDSASSALDCASRQHQLQKKTR